MRTYQQFREEMENEKNHVHGYIDYHADSPNEKVTRDKIQKHLHKYGGKSIQLKKLSKSPYGGHDVEFKGHVKHVQKMRNFHHDEDYPLTHQGYKKFNKDYE